MIFSPLIYVLSTLDFSPNVRQILHFLDKPNLVIMIVYHLVYQYFQDSCFDVYECNWHGIFFSCVFLIFF